MLTDAMAVGRNDHGHDLGAGSPGALLRRLVCTGGQVDVRVEYAPRLEYGLVHPILEAVPGGPAARGGADRLLLCAPVEFSNLADAAASQLESQTGISDCPICESQNGS